MLTAYDNLAPVHTADPVNRQHTLNFGRLAWWLTLPEFAGGGRWYDLMGFNHGTLTGMANGNSGWRASTRPGGFGSLLLDGVASYVDMGPVVSGTQTQGTIAGWIYRAATSNIAAIGWLDSPFVRFGLEWVNDGNLYGVLGSGDPGSYVVCSLAGVGWHRVLLTFNGSSLALYIDGVHQTIAGTAASAFSGYGTFKVGRDMGSARYGAQQADDVSLWIRSLGATEALEDYNLSRAGYPGLLNRLPQRSPGNAPAVVGGGSVSSGGLAISPHGMGIGL